MKGLIFALGTIMSFATVASVKVKLSNEDIATFRINASGDNAQNECLSKVAELVSNIEKSNRIIHDYSKKCVQDYQTEARGWVEVYKY